MIHDFSTEESKPWDRAVLDQIWKERMQLSYKPLLLLAMCDICDAKGRASLREVAQYFSDFFRARRDSQKQEDDLQGFAPGNLPSDRRISEWESVIRQEPLARISPSLLIADGTEVIWAHDHWAFWSSGFKKALRNTAETRLIEHYESRVPGGF